MTNDPSWLREQAHQWREYAEVCNPEDREKRLKLADDLEAMAAELEGRRADAAD